MNKNISVYTFMVIVLATSWLEVTAIAPSAYAQNKDLSLMYSPSVEKQLAYGRDFLLTGGNAQLVSNNDLANRDSQIALNIANKESKDNLTKIIFFASLVATGGLVWKISQARRRLKPSLMQIKTQSGSTLLDRVSPKLRRQLLRLVSDPKTANRLLMGVYKNNHHRSANWIAEKVIYDLRRGR